MKFIVTVFLIGLLAFASGLYLPWWSIAAASFLVLLLIPLRPLTAFLAGFSGIFLCWLIVAWLRNNANEGILAAKMAKVFGLNDSSFLLILLIAVVGGLVGGFSALSAAFFSPYARRVSV